MPTYEYECQRCGRFEETQSINAAPLDTCPRCGSRVRRLISRNPVIIFRGSGFHVTDYRSKEYREREKEEKKAESGSDKTAAG